METLSAFTLPSCCAVFLLGEASTRCGYPSLLTWLCTSMSAGLPRWNFLVLFHFLFHLKLVCSRSATSCLATALLSARGRASACSGPCCEYSSGSSVPSLALVESRLFSAQPCDQLLKLYIALTRSFQGVRIPPGTSLL